MKCGNNDQYQHENEINEDNDNECQTTDENDNCESKNLFFNNVLIGDVSH